MFTMLAEWTTRFFFVLMHVLAVTAVIGAGFMSPDATSVWVCFGFYVLRMFGITAGFHRYFSHKTYSMGRVTQFVMAFIGTAAAQRGPLWWAYHHREHHRCSDRECDPHSPIPQGGGWANRWQHWWACMRAIWRSHIGWVLSNNWRGYEPKTVKDLYCFPELRWLDRYHWVAPVVMIVFCFFLGALLAPEGFSVKAGGMMVLWGYVVGTVALYHVTFMVNSVCHLLGWRRYKTTDQSRNNAVVGILALGEGWHNNHHADPNTVRQGFRWWEIDMTYYILWTMRCFGLAWGFKQPHERELAKLL